MRLTIAVTKKGTPDTTLYEVRVPVMPQNGDYISHDKLGFAGTVHYVSYYWDEKGNFKPEVRILV